MAQPKDHQKPSALQTGKTINPLPWAPPPGGRWSSAAWVAEVVLPEGISLRLPPRRNKASQIPLLPAEPFAAPRRAIILENCAASTHYL